MSTSSYAGENCMFKFDDLIMSSPQGSIKSEDDQESEERTLLGDITSSEYSDLEISDDVDYVQQLAWSLDSFKALMSRLTSAFVSFPGTAQPGTWFAQASFSNWLHYNSDILNGPWLNREYGDKTLLEFLARVKQSLPPSNDRLRRYDSVQQDPQQILLLFRRAELEKNRFREAYETLCKEKSFPPYGSEVTRNYNAGEAVGHGVARFSLYPRPPMIQFIGDLNEVGEILWGIITESRYRPFSVRNSKQEYEQILKEIYDLKGKISCLEDSRRQIDQYPLYRDPVTSSITREVRKLDADRKSYEDRKKAIIVYYLGGRLDRLEQYDKIFDSTEYCINSNVPRRA